MGPLETADRDGHKTQNVFVEGTPEGFRMFAEILNHMAEQVESKEEKIGWGLTISPDEMPAIKLLDSKSLNLVCEHPERWNK